MPDRAPSLEPMKKALGRLDLAPIKDKQVILVAGTNGKGSVAKALEQLLHNSGLSTGLYTSPHLISIRERIRRNNQNICEKSFAQVFTKVEELCHDIPLSHFETLTLMACQVFFEKGNSVDWSIFEVGMGGTWDATNAVPHKICVITELGYDHQHLLGPSLQQIAANKFGIVTDASRVFHAPFKDLEVQKLAQSIKAKTHSEWHERAPYEFTVTPSGLSPVYNLRTQWGDLKLPLPGQRSAENMTLALTAFHRLGFESKAAMQSLETLQWPGRMSQQIHKKSQKPIYYSGDHNVDGVKSLIDLLKDYEYETLHLLIGIGKSKDLSTMRDLYAQIPRARIWLTQTPFMGRGRQSYGDWVDSAQGYIDDPIEALDQLTAQSGPKDMILVSGSLYLVGDLMAANVSHS